jgi:mRNA interferase RelE/StbE
MYQIKIERKAQKKLAKISVPYYSNIKTAILSLAENPRPTGCKKLKGREAYRIRVSNYRIIYEVVDDALLVLVIDVGHRRDIY